MAFGTAFGAAVYPTDTVDCARRSVRRQRHQHLVRWDLCGEDWHRAVDDYDAQPRCRLHPLFELCGGHGCERSESINRLRSLSGGDIKAGNEGVWQVDALQSQPLN